MPSTQEKDQAARAAAAKAMGVSVEDVLIINGVPEYRPLPFIKQATLKILLKALEHDNQG